MEQDISGFLVTDGAASDPLDIEVSCISDVMMSDDMLNRTDGAEVSELGKMVWDAAMERSKDCGNDVVVNFLAGKATG